MSKNQLSLRDNLTGDAFKNRLMQVLPKHLTPDRMVAVALSAMTKQPKLSAPDVDQSSFFKAMMTLSEVGLEPNGIHAHLIPFRNNGRNCTEVQLIIDYKGLILIASRSGFQCNAFAVFQGDRFDWNNGQVINHVPHYLLNNDAGDVIAFVCRLHDVANGLTHYEMMSRAEVDAVRQGSRAGNSGPWKSHFVEMGKKTVFRRAAKWLPMSPEITASLFADDDTPADLNRVQPITVDADTFRGILQESQQDDGLADPAVPPVTSAEDS